ncbi:uncharacterized protein Z519_05750 [Cladophialophora bantiana CBS 173.52]|uniref:Uncharacterized protein n=1 Tax=Cladophialophora bantiana (strain ATCC 10958 / CBS 173.52 / CDC B-1940 / NIH 8579) TaxID=1442370 RepID=A0A0D2HQN3_CLAB1|nr:uncharacterized protein Z519_05750 [Cladophialophora bantiana CBS 173.52]KIW93145.1 hypothetical protein Z519_05750 [Cladophialophora bantiana CBS 173.52]
MSEDGLPLGGANRSEDDHLSTWKMDRINVGPSSSTTDERQQSGNNLTASFSNLKIASLPNKMPAAIWPRTGDSSRETRPQRKRTVDGAIKDQRNSPPVSFGENELAQHDGYRQTPNMKLKLDLDILRRRIAAIEAQEQGSIQDKSVSKGARGQKPLARMRPQQQKTSTKGRQDPETENSLMDWKEAVIR